MVVPTQNIQVPKMTRFRQLTIEERYHIQFHFELGLSLRQIAKALNRAASTISRELRRNRQSPCKYWAPMAQDKADDRRKNADKQRITDAWLIEQVHYYLTQYQWSPEQISGYLARMHSVTVSMNGFTSICCVTRLRVANFTSTFATRFVKPGGAMAVRIGVAGSSVGSALSSGLTLLILANVWATGRQTQCRENAWLRSLRWLSEKPD